jgi:hypothetical protein
MKCSGTGFKVQSLFCKVIQSPTIWALVKSSALGTDWHFGHNQNECVMDIPMPHQSAYIASSIFGLFSKMHSCVSCSLKSDLPRTPESIPSSVGQSM